MKNKYFIRTLAIFLIPILIPVLVLGSLSFYSTQVDLKADIHTSNQHLLVQSQQQIDMVLNELNTLKLALYQNANVFKVLKEVLREPAFTYDSLNDYNIMMSFMHAIASTKPYIHSVYLYADNPNGRFVSSVDGILSIEMFNDRAWYDEFMDYEGPPAQWTSLRTIERTDTDIVTIHDVISAQNIAIFLNIRPKYIEDILSEIVIYDSQTLLIADENSEILFMSSPEAHLDASDIAAIAEHEAGYFDIRMNGELHSVSKIESEAYGWKFISLIPHASLYKTPARILEYTVIFGVVSFIVGLALTYYLTRRNYRRLGAISSLLESVDKPGEKLPALIHRAKDEYGYIMQNMIIHFIKHRFIRTQLSEKKYRLQVMEMLALQSQINPHFLYNTLNSIYWETVGLTGKPNDASEMVSSLSDLLAYSLSDPGSSVTWKDEIDNTVNYIHIQKRRYKDKFDVIFEYGEEILELRTMKLILQPLVENSLYHGIKEREGFGLIKIKIYARAGRLRVVVADNGIGMSGEQLAYVRDTLRRMELSDDPSRHIGLINTAKRLRLMYGHDITVAVNSKPGFGTAITIESPIGEAS